MRFGCRCGWFGEWQVRVYLYVEAVYVCHEPWLREKRAHSIVFCQDTFHDRSPKTNNVWVPSRWSVQKNTMQSPLREMHASIETDVYNHCTPAIEQWDFVMASVYVSDHWPTKVHNTVTLRKFVLWEASSGVMIAEQQCTPEKIGKLERRSKRWSRER